MSAPNIKQVAAAALASIERILSRWLPDGKRHRHEYVVRNPTRSDGKIGSFSINCNTGAWADFADASAKGRDLVALVAYLEGVKQVEAAKTLAAFLGMDTPKLDPAKCATSDQKKAGNTITSPTQSKQPTATTKSAAADTEVCVMPVPDDAPAPPSSHSRHGKPSQRYAYTTAAGAVNFYHDRYEAKKAGERKQFAPLTLWRSVAGKLVWQFKAAPDPRPLFGLPGLLAHPDADVWLCEGEKAAQALAVLLPAYPVLTWQGGAQAVSKTDFSPLCGRACIIFPDNDEAGHKAAAELVKRLQAAGAISVRVLDLAALALTAGWSADISAATLEAGEPLAAGDDAADLVARGWQAAHFALLQQRGGLFVEAEAQEATAPDEASTPAPKSETRRRYFLSESDGVYVVEPTKSGEAYCAPRAVCDRLDVLALARDPGNGGWGLLVEFADRDNVKHRLVVPARSFNGEGLEATGMLYDKGLYIAPNGRRAVLDYLQTQSPEKRARTTSRTGWHGEGDELLFVLPDGAIGTATDEWLFDSGAPDASPYKQRGTLKQWRDNVASLCAGNSRLVFAVCSAFASPLLHLIGEESGGFHYRGGSSGGKTTALRAAASVCGSPEYMQRWRATDNGLEALAMTHCDAPLLLDELKQIDAKVAGETAYMLANGSGKARANQSGGARTIARWRLLFLSAGELSLSQHMAEAGKKVHAGQELRMADIPADAGVGLGCFEQLHNKAGGHEFANALAAAMGKYYGTAFPAFVQRALSERERLSASLREAQAAFEKAALTHQASGQARRAAARFALVGAAGEFATEWGITGWNAGEAMKAAQVCFAAWLGSYGGEGNQEQRAMLKQVRRFMELHGEARFADFGRPVADDDHAPRVINKAGWRKHDNIKSETEYYVYPEVFKAEICSGMDYKAVARLLIDKGYMRPDGKHLQPKVALPGEGKRRVFHILPTLWDDENA
ncbi:MAG: DUF927 domain-containing protein [Nitrosomonadales bacterium]|nr:DUF927 domain-containing protein [Nitrosomonadales bacterium]